MAAKEPADQPRKPAAAGSGLYTFANTVTITYRRHTLTFRDGVAYPLHADLVAYLATNGIVPVQA